MIPFPRPSLPFGACMHCGRLACGHDAACAEVGTAPEIGPPGAFWEGVGVNGSFPPGEGCSGLRLDPIIRAIT